VEPLLNEPYFTHHLRPLVEQLHDLIVNGVDAPPGRLQRLRQVRVLSEKRNGGKGEHQKSHGHLIAYYPEGESHAR
jgi:hypothetical protein